MVKLVALLMLVMSVSVHAEDQAASGSTKADSVRRLDLSSPLRYGLDLFFSPRPFPNYIFTNGVQSADRGLAFQLSFEWMPITEYGKAGIGATAGFSVLPNVVIVEAADDETATLYSVPLGGFISYRLDYFVDQIIVPYARLGMGIELSKQNSQYGHSLPNMRSFPYMEVAFGGQLLLDWIEKQTSTKMDSRWGINNTYLYFEYTMISALGSSAEANLARNEMRFGLRFEI